MVSKITLMGLLSFFGASLYSMDDAKFHHIKKSAILASHKLGDINLYHDGSTFHVKNKDEVRPVKKHDMDKFLRSLTPDRLKALEKHGYIHVKQWDDGSYYLQSNVRGKGSGPILSNFCYWMTKGIGYGVPVVVGTGVLVSTLPTTGPGVIGGVTGATGAGINFAGGLTLKSLVGTTVTQTGATAIVSKGIIGAVGTKAATDAVVTATAVSSGMVGSYMGFVESCALGLAAIAMALPTP